MKLKALDQIAVSSVKADAIRPGEVFEVSDVLGNELLTKRPALPVARVDEAEDVEVSAKAEGSAPSNKAEKPVANKAKGKQKAPAAA